MLLIVGSLALRDFNNMSYYIRTISGEEHDISDDDFTEIMQDALDPSGLIIIESGKVINKAQIESIQEK